jgi:hypothetical protein
MYAGNWISLGFDCLFDGRRLQFNALMLAFRIEVDRVSMSYPPCNRSHYASASLFWPGFEAAMNIIRLSGPLTGRDFPFCKLGTSRLINLTSQMRTIAQTENKKYYFNSTQVFEKKILNFGAF